MTTTDIIGNLAGVAALAIGGIVVARVYRKQTLAADIRRAKPGTSYHDSIGQAWRQLGHDKHPFRV